MRVPAGAVVLSPAEAGELARVVRMAERLAWAASGSGLPGRVLELSDELDRVARVAAATEALTSTDVDVSTSVPDRPDGAGFGHGLDADEVARRLGCTPGNVRDLARRGALPGRQVGRRWVFDPADVVEHAAARPQRSA